MVSSDALIRRVHSLLSEDAYDTLLRQYHSVARVVRTLSAPIRALPDFIIVGAQKSGTTSLYRYLLTHPEIKGVYTYHPNGETTWGKEVHYFNSHFDRPVSWYRFHFPIKPSLSPQTYITGEGSPGYLYHPHVAGRIAHLVPETRIIICLRNPVDRAISHYYHQVRKGVEDLPMSEAFEREEERIQADKLKMEADNNYFGKNLRHYSYLDRGIYADQVERYFQHFDRSRVLILKSEDLFAETQPTFDRVVSFLNLPSHQLTNVKSYNSGSYGPSDADIRKKLAEYFRPHNQRLYELLDIDNPWW